MTEVKSAVARQPDLDRLRGLAILMVIGLHYWAHDPAAWGNRFLAAAADRVLGAGWMGVDLFFVLSGFLLGGALIDRRGSTNLFSTFYARRIFRIVPLYALIVASWVAVSGSRDLWMYASFTQNIFWGLAGGTSPRWMAVTWSLAVEEQFYLCLPLIVFLSSPRQLPRALLVLICVAPLARMLIVWGLRADPKTAYEFMPCRMDSLFLGVLVAWAVRQCDIRQFVTRHRSALWSAIGIGAIGIVAAQALRWDYMTIAMWLPGYSWIAAFFALVLLATVTRPTGPRAGPLAWIGERSYSIYLIHVPVVMVVEHLTGPGVWGPLIALSVTIVLGGALYRLVETPLLAFAHLQFRYRDKRQSRRGNDRRRCPGAIEPCSNPQ